MNPDRRCDGAYSHITSCAQKACVSSKTQVASDKGMKLQSVIRVYTLIVDLVVYHKGNNRPCVPEMER